MTDLAELEQLTTAELHDRAVKTAERHLDVRFLWNLLGYIPEAEALSGDVREGDQDIQRASGLLFDYVRRGGKLDDALRPVYIDYLEQHSKR
jgi:hypothetical protein